MPLQAPDSDSLLAHASGANGGDPETFLRPNGQAEHFFGLANIVAYCIGSMYPAPPAPADRTSPQAILLAMRRVGTDFHTWFTDHLMIMRGGLLCDITDYIKRYRNSQLTGHFRHLSRRLNLYVMVIGMNIAGNYDSGCRVAGCFPQKRHLKLLLFPKQVRDQQAHQSTRGSGAGAIGRQPLLIGIAGRNISQREAGKHDPAASCIVYRQGRRCSTVDQRASSRTQLHGLSEHGRIG